MPRKNVVKQYLENGYYHIYNRGVNKQEIFSFDDDYQYFIMLFGRYLSATPQSSKNNYVYPCYGQEINLLSYCLMPNHFHLLVQQTERDGITRFMRSLATAYSMYYKNHYNSMGHVFESRFKASLITDDSYMLHISRYIHLNPTDFQRWKYSSYQYILNKTSPNWLSIKPILDMFPNNSYKSFVEDYIPQMRLQKTINSI